MVQPSKSRTVKVTDTCGILEAYSQIDKDLVELNGNSAAFRLSEAKSFIETMQKDVVDTLIYGNTNTDPEKYMGLAPRYALTTAENGGNIVEGDGTGSANTSIWLVCWSPETCHMIYPKGSKAGLQHTDLGQVTAIDATTTGFFEAYRDNYQWKVGLSLRHWRYVVRIANVDVDNLVKGAATGSDLVDLMTQAIELLPSMGMGRCVFYCNRTIKSMSRRQISNNSNVNLTLDNVMGKHVMSFDGIPVKRVDSILNTEDTIS